MATKSIYPSIPAPGATLDTIVPTINAMRQTLTMVIMNAQKPNPNFAPSSASQQFVTYDELKRLGTIGPTGPTGPAGPPGPGIPEAPVDINTYGRHNVQWLAVLPTSGGTMTGALLLRGSPTADLEATSKKYVDDSIAAVVIFPDAPMDGKYYVRQNGAWVPGVEEAPQDGTKYVRQNGAWVAA